MRRTLAIAVVTIAGCASSALAVSDQNYAKAREMIDKSIAWLRSQQDAKTGGWSLNPDPNGPNYPAISALVLTGMLGEPTIDADDPGVAKGISFVLGYRQSDGGIYDKVLPSYNTSICLSMLALVERPEAADAIKPAQNFLRGLQWSEDSLDRPQETARVERSHPFYGGIGYGRHGRPDASNLNMAVQAMHDSGLSSDDPIYKRALVFLSRTQMLDSVNDQPYADGSHQGGFIYATGDSLENAGKGQSSAGTIEETLDNGSTGTRLRAYGSMTYGGFKSMIYANLKRDDPRVVAARDWIRKNYTVEENPGAGTDGLYYYMMMMSKALKAWGGSTISTLKPDGSAGETRDWGDDIVTRLSGLQNADGSFKSVDDRWMESNPVLITAYSVLTLQKAIE